MTDPPLELYQWTERQTGRRGHVSGTSREEAVKRLQQRLPQEDINLFTLVLLDTLPEEPQSYSWMF